MRDANHAASAWRFFPLAIIGGLGVTIAVNGGMIWSAIATFPGKAGRDGFELSNRYNQVLDQEALQARLGWLVRARIDTAGRPELTVTDTTGQPLPGLKIEAIAARPLGDEQRTPLLFIDHGAGRFVADQPLPAAGQWDLTIAARGGTTGRDLRVTRRVHMP